MLSKAERAICADPALSRLDDELGTAYRAALEEATDKPRLRREQRVWLKDRDSECQANTECFTEKTWQRISALADYLSLGSEPPKHACYRIVRGARFAMCRAFTKNLNQLCAGRPVTCTRELHPDFKNDFRYPDWNELKPAEHLEIIAEIVRSLARRPDSPSCKGQCEEQWREQQWQEHRPELTKRLAAGKVKLWRTRIDLDPPLHPDPGYKPRAELVYRLEASECGIEDRTPAYVLRGPPALMVLDENTGKFDPDFAAGLISRGLDIIYYKGRVHLFGGLGYGTFVSILDVTSGPGIGTFAAISAEVCNIEYLH
jgi:hypothetical protein